MILIVSSLQGQHFRRIFVSWGTQIRKCQLFFFVQSSPLKLDTLPTTASPPPPSLPPSPSALSSVSLHPWSCFLPKLHHFVLFGYFCSLLLTSHRGFLKTRLHRRCRCISTGEGSEKLKYSSTGHCGLCTHLKRIGISDTSLCDCGQGDLTHDHVLQSCQKAG